MPNLPQEKNKKPREDYLIPSINVPFSPEIGADLAALGMGRLTDNHHNYMSGLAFFDAEHGKHYQLTLGQWYHLEHVLLRPHLRAVGSRVDNKIPVLFNLPSPLEVFGEEMGSFKPNVDQSHSVAKSKDRVK